jgi:hypothetical protein
MQYPSQSTIRKGKRNKLILKTITFPNYLEETETEDFYFNLSKGELVKMQMAAIDERTESFQDKLEKIGKSLNGKALIETIDEVIDASYGVKTVDGKRFIKNAKDLEVFKSSGAYSELVVELCTDADACSTFINGLVPKNLRDEVQKEVAQSARERSQAGLQGFQKKQEAPKPTVQQVPEIPTVIEATAEPVLEKTNEQIQFEAWKAQQVAAN